MTVSTSSPLFFPAGRRGRRRFASAAPFLLAVFLLAAPPRLPAAETAFTSPLAAGAPLTSNFGEYRINHFHSGIDLGTGGETGLPVFAAADGRVAVIKASPAGYGKVAYLEHEGGSVTVYAHLSEFSETLDPVARQCQRAAGRYTFEKAWKGDGPRVKAGDVVGYSGSTGTSVPHLHFEIRRGGLPLNPLTNGFPYPDHVPPRITRIAVIPLSAAAHVEGLPDLRVFNAPAAGDVLRLAAGGRFGLAVECTDAVDGGTFRLEPYGLRMAVDGKAVYGVRFERFDYAERAVSELNYLYEMKEEKVGAFHRLFYHAEPSLFHDGESPGEVEPWGPGLHRVEITALDAAGNASRVDLVVEVVPPLPLLPVYHARGVETAFTPTRTQVELKGSRLSLRLAPVPAGDTVVSAAARFPGSGEPPAACTVLPLKDGPALRCDVPAGFQGQALIFWQSASGKAWAASVPVQSAAAGATLTSPDGAATVTLGPEAVFRPFPTAAWKDAPRSGRGLVPVSDLYVFEQPWEPLRRKVKVSIRPTAEGKGKPDTGIYLFDRGTLWFLDVGTSALVTHLGAFLLMRDTLPPVVGNCRTPVARGRRILFVSCSDAGSGLTDDGLRMSVDGHPVIGELNPATGGVYYYPVRPLKKGLHSVSLSVADRAGHRTTRTFKVRIP
ncbi:MAG: M23 family metallopeptidase [Acidobacteria bacterium]|nr:M23 family metallopeptidase [Acidobacteriota bacterium]